MRITVRKLLQCVALLWLLVLLFLLRRTPSSPSSEDDPRNIQIIIDTLQKLTDEEERAKRDFTSKEKLRLDEQLQRAVSQYLRGETSTPENYTIKENVELIPKENGSPDAQADNAGAVTTIREISHVVPQQCDLLLRST